MPHNECFKPYNTLTLAVISNPKELKLHGINNYLYPIINQLNQLWEGYQIKMNKYSNGQFICGTIIGYSCNVPASQKLCGFISACIACYWYYKSANFVNNQPNFREFEDFDDWFIKQDISVIRKNSSKWKKYTTKKLWKAHVSWHHIHWSEIYQLLYFNPVHYCVVDPIHCLFFSIAK